MAAAPYARAILPAKVAPLKVSLTVPSQNDQVEAQRGVDMTARWEFSIG